MSHTAFYLRRGRSPDGPGRTTGSSNDPSWTRPSSAPADVDRRHPRHELRLRLGRRRIKQDWEWSQAGSDPIDGSGGIDQYQPAYVVTTDPRGIDTREKFDHFGRRFELIENFLTTTANGNWAPLGTDQSSGEVVPTEDELGNAQADANRVTTWTYNGLGQITSQTAYDGPGSGDKQVTTLPLRRTCHGPFNFTVRTTCWAGARSTATMSSAYVSYPSRGRGVTRSSPTPRRGQPLSKIDRNGTEHVYGYDDLGRLTSDTVETIGGSTSTFVGTTGNGPVVKIDDVVDRLDLVLRRRGALE